MLALQQQLALAVSADRKKDIMIEQLDKTLEKVVEGWRRHEREKSEGHDGYEDFITGTDFKEIKVQMQSGEVKGLLASFEKSLSEAAEALDKQQKRSEELQNVNKQQGRELAELRVCVEELRVRAEERRSEAEEERAKSEKLQTLTVTLQTELDQQNQQSRHSLSQLQQDITRLTQQLDTERERVGQEVQLREEAQSTVRQLQQELEETRRERDTARVDRALDQARFEAQRSQWEVELRLCVEQQVTERLANIQQENSTATAKLREQHRKQLLDLSARQERELSAQMEEFRVQLEEKDEKQQQLTLHFNNKMAALQEEMVSMEASKRRLETQREELVSRLQGMMRSHWTEALRLLSSQEQADGIFSPMSLWDGSKPHSSPHDPEDSSICSTANTLTSAAPRAVVLHLSRERERGMRGEEEVRVERGRGESDFGLLDHSHVFCPLEPVLDDTDLTAVGGSNLTGLWDRPVGGEKQREGRRERTEREGGRTGIRGEAVEMGPTVRSPGESSGQTLNQTSNHFRNQDSYSDSNCIRSQFEQCVNRQANQNPDQSVRLNQVHASSERLTSQSYSSEKGAGRCDVSVEKYSGAGIKAPPMKEQSLSIKERAPPTGTSSSSLGEDRQNELQYYISKLLDRSPGDPLEEQPAEQRKAETQSVNPGMNSQWDGFSSGPRALVNSLLTRAPAPPQTVNPPSSTQTPCGPQVTPSVLQGQVDPQLEQLAGLLRLALPQTPTDQQLQQLLGSLIRPEEPSTDPIRANLDRKLAQNEKREQRQPPSRAAPSASARGRRSGPQSHRSGSKGNVWR
ncbi:hypothetical protein AOLI_G00152820 [Acnodon oligacanthus]